MSEFERIILEKLAQLETEVQQLRSERLDDTPAQKFERLPASATVGKDYVAYRFGCSERAVVRGEAGTYKIPRVSRKPLKFIKSKVDEAWREYTKTPAERAAAERANAKTRTRKTSIIKIKAA